VANKHEQALAAVAPAERHDLLCDLNVIEQVENVCQTTVVQDAWDRGQELTVHGWLYGLDDGRLHDLEMAIDSNADLKVRYPDAIERVGRRRLRA
jgi:carbonic anhydrase